MQNITGLTVGRQYTFSFLAAERPGYGNSESISVSIGNVCAIYTSFLTICSLSVCGAAPYYSLSLSLAHLI